MLVNIVTTIERAWLCCRSSNICASGTGRSGMRLPLSSDSPSKSESQPSGGGELKPKSSFTFKHRCVPSQLRAPIVARFVWSVICKTSLCTAYTTTPPFAVAAFLGLPLPHHRPASTMGIVRTTLSIAGWGSLASVAGWVAMTRNCKVVPIPASDYIFNHTLYARNNPNNAPVTQDICIRRVPLSKIKPELLEGAEDGKLVEAFCQGVWSGLGTFGVLKSRPVEANG